MNTHPFPADWLNRRINVSVVGAGGSGCQIINGLARLHISMRELGHEGLAVTLFDPDKVSEANIGRQLFSYADIGQPKAVVLINRLNLFYGLDWIAAPHRYKADSESRWNPPLIIGCVDSAASRREIARASKEGYWLDLGNAERTGQVILGQFKDSERRRAFDPDKTELLRLPLVTELFPDLLDPRVKESNQPSCSLAEALGKQDLFINQAVATFALNLLWTWYRYGSLTYHGGFINLQTGITRPLPIDPEAWKRMTQIGATRTKKKKVQRKAKASKRKTK